MAQRVRAAAGAKRLWQRSAKPFALASAQSPPHQPDAPRQKHSSGQRCHPELELKLLEMRAYIYIHIHTIWDYCIQKKAGHGGDLQMSESKHVTTDQVGTQNLSVYIYI